MNRNMIEIKFVDGTRCWVPKCVMGIKTKKLTESHNIAKAMQWIFHSSDRCVWCFRITQFYCLVDISCADDAKGIIGRCLSITCQTCGKDQFAQKETK